MSLEEIEILVLDEADRMVDMGFAPDLRRILSLLPAEAADADVLGHDAARAEPRRAARRLTTPQRVDLAPPSRPAAGITQAIYPVPRALKTDLLDEMLVAGDVQQRHRVHAHQARRGSARAPALAAAATPSRRSTAIARRVSASARSTT